MIEVNHLTKKYGNNTAVKDLSFKVEKGQVYGLLGKNGAGKSTTMNIITGFLAATEGTVIIDGHDIYEEPMEAKKCIGYLPEIPPLYEGMTVREYLLFAAELKKLKGDDKLKQVQEVMEMTGITRYENRLVGNLSKGFKQRVGLAQAVLGYPPILILDEPTVGLDPQQIIEIRQLIKELAKDRTIILSSHILSEVSEICDHIFIISSGKLVADDSSENLVRRLDDNSTKLELTVKGEKDAAIETLKAVKGVKKVSERSVAKKEKGAVSLELDVTSKQDIREDIFWALAEAKLPVLELHMTKSTLEDVFLALTQDEGASDEHIGLKKDKKKGKKRLKKAKKVEPSEVAEAASDDAADTAAEAAEAAEVEDALGDVADNADTDAATVDDPADASDDVADAAAETAEETTADDASDNNDNNEKGDE